MAALALCALALPAGFADANPAGAPAAPQNLGAGPGPGPATIHLAWVPPAGGQPVTNYTIYRSDSAAGPFVAIADLGDASTFMDTGLPHNATRYYVVSALNGAGEGGLSNLAGATTFAPPGAPHNRQAIPVLVPSGRVTLDHSSPLCGTPLPAIPSAPATPHAPAGLPSPPGIPSSMLGGAGVPANGALCFPLLLPQSSVGPIRVSWQPPMRDGGMPVTNYTLYRGPAAGQETPLVRLGNATSYLDQDCPALRKCFYRVTATNAVAEGLPSNELFAAWPYASSSA